MTLDELIKKATDLREIHGGEIKVGIENQEFFTFYGISGIEERAADHGDHVDSFDLYGDSSDLGDLFIGIS